MGWKWIERLVPSVVAIVFDCVNGGSFLALFCRVRSITDTRRARAEETKNGRVREKVVIRKPASGEPTILAAPHEILYPAKAPIALFLASATTDASMAGQKRAKPRL